MTAAEQRETLHSLIDELSDAQVGEALVILQREVLDESAVDKQERVRSLTAQMIRTHDETLRKLAK